MKVKVVCGAHIEERVAIEVAEELKKIYRKEIRSGLIEFYDISKYSIVRAIKNFTDKYNTNDILKIYKQHLSNLKKENFPHLNEVKLFGYYKQYLTYLLSEYRKIKEVGRLSVKRAERLDEKLSTSNDLLYRIFNYEDDLAKQYKSGTKKMPKHLLEIDKEKRRFFIPKEFQHYFRIDPLEKILDTNSFTLNLHNSYIEGAKYPYIAHIRIPEKTDKNKFRYCFNNALRDIKENFDSLADDKLLKEIYGFLLKAKEDRWIDYLFLGREQDLLFFRKSNEFELVIEIPAAHIYSPSYEKYARALLMPHGFFLYTMFTISSSAYITQLGEVYSQDEIYGDFARRLKIADPYIPENKEKWTPLGVNFCKKIIDRLLEVKL